MKISIQENVYNDILKSARVAVPLEACGLLGGKEGKAVKFYELKNMDNSSEHYNMSPEEQFAAVKDMRKHGLKMIAIWHSHPETPPRMSEEDLRLALTPDVRYLIISLLFPDMPVIKGYNINDGVQEEVWIDIIKE